MSATAPSPQTLLPPNRRGRFSFAGLTALMNSVGTAWIFVLLLLINADIIGRTLFNRPVRGTTEIVGMTIVACVFLQLSHALQVGRLTRSDVILIKIEQYHPRWRLVLEALFNLAAAAILVILLIYSVPLLTEAWSSGEYEGAEGEFMAPIWPVKLIIVVGCLTAAIQSILNVYHCIKKISAV